MGSIINLLKTLFYHFCITYSKISTLTPINLFSTVHYLIWIFLYTATFLKYFLIIARPGHPIKTDRYSRVFLCNYENTKLRSGSTRGCSTLRVARCTLLGHSIPLHFIMRIVPCNSTLFHSVPIPFTRRVPNALRGIPWRLLLCLRLCCTFCFASAAASVVVVCIVAAAAAVCLLCARAKFQLSIVVVVVVAVAVIVVWRRFLCLVHVN